MKNAFIVTPAHFPVIYAVPRQYATYVGRFKKFSVLLLILALMGGTSILLALHAHLL